MRENNYTPKVLVTGAGGYIGSYLIQCLLQNDIGCIAVDTFPEGQERYTPWIIAQNTAFSIQKNNVDSIRIPDEVDTVIHLAAVVGAKACDENPEEAKKTNLEATKKLLWKCKGRRFIFVNTNCGLPAGKSDETAELHPNSLYGQTKSDAEKLVVEHGGVSLRLASVFGVSIKMRDDLLLNFLVKEAIEYGQINLFEGSYKRNFVHVSDVCDVIIKMTSCGAKPSGIYNVAIPEHLTKLEVCDRIKRFRPNTKIILSDGKDPDARNYEVSTEKLAKWGWEASVTYEDGIKELINYYEFNSL